MEKRDLDITLHSGPDAHYVRLSGAVHVSNARQLVEFFNDLREGDGPATIYVSLRDVESIDSGGLGAIVQSNLHFRKTKKKLVLFHPRPDHTRLFALSKVNLILQIVEGPEADRIDQELQEMRSSG